MKIKNARCILAKQAGYQWHVRYLCYLRYLRYLCYLCYVRYVYTNVGGVNNITTFRNNWNTVICIMSRKLRDFVQLISLDGDVREEAEIGGYVSWLRRRIGLLKNIDTRKLSLRVYSIEWLNIALAYFRRHLQLCTFVQGMFVQGTFVQGRMFGHFSN